MEYWSVMWMSISIPNYKIIIIIIIIMLHTYPFKTFCHLKSLIVGVFFFFCIVDIPLCCINYKIGIKYLNMSDFVILCKYVASFLSHYMVIIRLFKYIKPKITVANKHHLWDQVEISVFCVTQCISITFLKINKMYISDISSVLSAVSAGMSPNIFICSLICYCLCTLIGCLNFCSCS
jgi:hypothetical protein